MCRNEASFAPAAIAYHDTYHEVFGSNKPQINELPRVVPPKIPASKLKLSASILFEHLNALHTSGYEVKLTVKIRAFNTMQRKWNPIQNKTLTINFSNKNGAVYKESDWILLDNVSYAEVFLDRVEGTFNDEALILPESIWTESEEQLGSTVNFCETWNEALQKIPFEIRAEIISENTSSYTASIQPFSASGCDGLIASYLDAPQDVRVSWCNVPWADEYELQWTYADNYAENASGVRDNVQYSFRQNYGNARFRNTQGNTGIPNTYEMPLVYERGFLVFRIRGIKYLNDDFKNPKYGPWSSPQEGRVNPSATHVVHINAERAHEQGWFNWQRISYFAENGKRKDVVAYFDGTMRQRQIVTRKNDDKSVVTAETIFDRQGRPAVQVLPAGVSCNTIQSVSDLFRNNPQTVRNAVQGSSPKDIAGMNMPATATDVDFLFDSYTQNTDMQEAVFGAPEVAVIGGRVVSIPGSPQITLQPDFTATNQNDADVLCERSKRLAYQANFNQSDRRGTAYSYTDFDNSAQPVAGMSTASGASRFYSNQNNDKNFAENKFIADADKYPFAFTEYENNPTQRVKKTYAPGAEFRPGSGKETSYIYTRPVQEELDRIFGTDVGIASHYAKNITIDANGQQAIQYLDAGGKVIATALAGEVPPHLMDAGMQTFSLKTNLLDGDQAFITNSIPYREASFPLEIESDNQTVNFDYLLNFSDYNVGCGNFCLDCVYDLSLRIQTLNLTTGGFDTLIIKSGISGQALVDYQCNADGTLPVQFSKSLNRGSYLITRRLAVNEAALNNYIAKIRREALSPNRTCLSPPVPPTNIPDCDVDCRECAGNAPTKPAWCADFCSDDPCRSYMKLMLADVSPGGQYGATSPTNPSVDAYNRSVFSLNGRPDAFAPLNAGDRNEARSLATYSWRNPQASPYNLLNRYNNADGTASVIVENLDRLSSEEKDALREAGRGNSNIEWDDVTQSVTIKKPELAPLTVFLRHWKDSWASALLPYHPEYCQLLYCRFFEKDHNASITAFRKETNTNTLKDWMNNPTRFIDQDKLFQGADRAVWRNKMISRIDGRETAPYNFPFKHRVLAPMYCQNPNFTLEQITSCVAGRQFGDDPERLMREWNVFIEMYVQARREIEEEFKQSIIGGQIETTPLNTPASISSVSSAVPLCFPASFIGNREIENNYYADAVRHFPQPFTSSTAVASALGCSDLSCANKQDEQAPGNCNTCRETQHLNVLLASLAFDGRLATPINSRLADHYTMTRGLLDALPNPGELEYSWVPSLSSDGRELTAQIMTGERLQGTLRMRFEKTGLAWSDVVTLLCLEDLSEPYFYRYLSGGKHFTVKAYLNNDTESLIEGHFSLNAASLSCGNRCRLSADGKAVYALIRHLIDANLLGNEDLVLHRAGQRLPDYILPQLIPTGLTNYRSLNWRFNRSTKKGSIFFVIDNATAKGGGVGCIYDLTFPAGFDENTPYQVDHASVNPEPPADGSCTKSSFSIAVHAQGRLPVLTIGVSTQGANCAKLVDCCGCDNLVLNGNFNNPISGLNEITGTWGLGSYNELGEVFDQTPDTRAETQRRTFGSLSFDQQNGCYLVASNVSRAAGAGSTLVQLWNYSLPASMRSYTNYSFSFLTKELRNNADLDQLQVVVETDDGGITLEAAIQKSFAGFTQVKTHFTMPRGRNPKLRIYYAMPGYVDAPLTENNLFAFDNISLTEEGCNTTCCPPEQPPIQQVPPCAETRREAIAQQQGELDAAETERLLNRVKEEYTRKCMQSIEQFTAEKLFKIYHYTLYYYDRAGNLIKTIPPEGVAALQNNSELEAVKTKRANQTFENAALESNRINPAHTLASTYVFNTYNQLVSQKTPDAGSSVFFYDELGRAHLSRDARMLADNERKIAYVLYDKLGRVFESGVVSEDQLSTLSNRRKHNQVQARILAGTREEVSRFFYDNPITGLKPEIAAKQNNLRNRVAAVAFYSTSNASHAPEKYDHATLFNYDLHGLNKDIWQHARYAEIDVAHQLKHVRYKYDVASGLVNEIWYQPEQTDQFIHRNVYDAENRLMSVFSGTHEQSLSRDLKLHYYTHGPLARKEMGAEGMLVQGIDYAYTLHGMLKVVNSTALRPENDMGADSLSIARAAVPADVYGYSLYYHENDYKPIGNLSPAELPVAPLAGNVLNHFPQYQGKRGLYNGNIMATSASYKAQAATPDFNTGTYVQAYCYDQLGRLRSAQAFEITNLGATNSWSAAASTEAYKSTYTYDLNGNLLSLVRRDAAGNEFDNLSYHYDKNSADRLLNNRLRYITDTRGFNTAIGDLSNQNANNYTYDDAGNLKTDAKSEASYDWTYKGRIKSVRDGSGKRSTYAYDAYARRVLKTTPDGKVQYYVSDANGNTLAVYELSNAGVKWKYSPIYAGSRIGTYKADSLLTGSYSPVAGAFERGKKRYELGNHLGDVAVVISDRKNLNVVPAEAATFGFRYAADVLSLADYFPFGMEMPGRATSGENYAYAYNGMERDKKAGADGYTTEFRQYDPRVGRWMSVDPKTSKYPSQSPFKFGNNNPLFFNDLKGGEETICLVGNLGFDASIFVGVTGREIEGGIYRATCVSISGTFPFVNVESDRGRYYSTDGEEIGYGFSGGGSGHAGVVLAEGNSVREAVNNWATESFTLNAEGKATAGAEVSLVLPNSMQTPLLGWEVAAGPGEGLKLSKGLGNRVVTSTGNSEEERATAELERAAERVNANNRRNRRAAEAQRWASEARQSAAAERERLVNAVENDADCDLSPGGFDGFLLMPPDPRHPEIRNPGACRPEVRVERRSRQSEREASQYREQMEEQFQQEQEFYRQQDESELQSTPR